MAHSLGVSGLLAWQPFKGLYVLLALAFNAARLPWWLVRFLLPSLRQNPAFTYRQAVGTEILRNVVHAISVIRVFTPMRLEPGPGVKDEKRYVRIEPSSEKTATSEGSRYTGVVSSTPQIQPAPTFGIWYPARPTEDALERLRVDEKAPPLILHFHGGAFAIGDPRPGYVGYLGGLFSTELGPTLCASYRLASNPNGAFPAALQDAITAYSYVVSTLNIPAHRIVLSGDSAGANLVLALLRYIARYPDSGLESPAAALLWSPWLDVSASMDSARIYSSPHSGTDYLPFNFIFWGASSISHSSSNAAGDQNEAAIDGPWISPGRHAFRTTTSIWIQASGLEILYEDIAAFAPKMKAIEGNDVELYVEPIANHDIVLTAPSTGFEKEAINAVKQANAWLSSKMRQKQ